MTVTTETTTLKPINKGGRQTPIALALQVRKIT